MGGIRSLSVFTFIVVSAASAAAQQQSAGVVPQVRGLPSVVTRPGSLATIRGSATTANNGSLPNSIIRLRDARFGRIVNTTLTDRSGGFAFQGLDPGNYIVELVGTNQAPIAATQILNANAGETITAVVRLPLGKPSLLASILSQQAGSSPGGAGVTGVADVVSGVVEQLPQFAVQSIPAIVPVGEPVSETRAR